MAWVYDRGRKPGHVKKNKNAPPARGRIPRCEYGDLFTFRCAGGRWLAVLSSGREGSDCSDFYASGPALSTLGHVELKNAILQRCGRLRGIHVDGEINNA